MTGMSKLQQTLLLNTTIKIDNPMEYAYFPNEFSVILDTLLALMFIYCK